MRAMGSIWTAMFKGMGMIRVVLEGGMLNYGHAFGFSRAGVERR